MSQRRFREVMHAAALAPGRVLWQGSRLGEKWSFPWADTENHGRHQWRETRLIERCLDMHRGMWVADVGAGAGYWTFRIADAVGPTGRVHAIDADWDACLKLQYEKLRRRIRNVRVRWVGRGNPHLAAEAFDVVLAIDAHLFAENRVDQGRRYLQHIARGLRTGGQLLLFNRAIHTTEWQPDIGPPLSDADAKPDQVASLAEPLFEVETLEALPIDGPRRPLGEAPGYLMSMRKRGS